MFQVKCFISCCKFYEHIKQYYKNEKNVTSHVLYVYRLDERRWPQLNECLYRLRNKWPRRDWRVKIYGLWSWACRLGRADRTNLVSRLWPFVTTTSMMLLSTVSVIRVDAEFQIRLKSHAGFVRSTCVL